MATEKEQFRAQIGKAIRALQEAYDIASTSTSLDHLAPADDPDQMTYREVLADSVAHVRALLLEFEASIT